MVTIAGRQIGAHCKPFIVAEMSCNHNHSLQRAKQAKPHGSRVRAEIGLENYGSRSAFFEAGYRTHGLILEKSLDRVRASGALVGMDEG